MNKPMNQCQEMKENIENNIPPSLFYILTGSHLYLHQKTEKCVFNEYGQCIKGFRYFCVNCNYGIGGMFSPCQNRNCYIPKVDNLVNIQFSSKFDYFDEKN